MNRALTLSLLFSVLSACVPDGGVAEPEPSAEPEPTPDAGALDGGGDAGFADAGAPDAGGDDAGCVDDAPCANVTCGLVTDACGATVSCGSCVTPDELDQLAPRVDEVVDHLWSTSYMQDVFDLDPNAVREHALTAFENIPDPGRAHIAALGRAVRGFKNGHTGFGLSLGGTCREQSGADSGISVYGVCAHPRGDHFVVSQAPGTSNPLALDLGDEVLAVNGLSGPALHQLILDDAVCGNGAGNDSVAHDLAAAALFSWLRPGDVLDVRAPDGTLHTVVVGDEEAAPVYCRYPAGPTGTPLVTATLRPDNVAVIALTRFVFFPGEPGYDEDYLTQLANMTQAIEDELDTVRDDAVGVVWDLRGNIGGYTFAGLEVVSGMPGAMSTFIARCWYRVPGSDPLDYQDSGPFQLTPSPRFDVGVPAAVLIDGRTISAGDYFARAAQVATDARLFGRPAAGAYGGGGAYIELSESPGYYLSYDPYRCDDEEGLPLETRSVEPDELVELSPDDLVAGRDTVVERAAAWILDQAP